MRPGWGANTPHYKPGPPPARAIGRSLGTTNGYYSRRDRARSGSCHTSSAIIRDLHRERDHAQGCSATEERGVWDEGVLVSTPFGYASPTFVNMHRNQRYAQ